jgi:uncharacterized protein (DUF1330 family)
MAGYLLARNMGVRDPAGISEYYANAPAIIAQYGGKFLTRGGASELMEGEGPAGVTIIEFPSMDQAKAFYNSPEYRPFRDIRQRSADTQVFILEGI